MRHLWSKAVAIGVVVGFCVPAPAALAWSENGHRAISFIAERYLRQPALDEVNMLLATDIATSDGLDLVSAAGWADRYRETAAARHEATFRWHFADIQVARPNIPLACFGQRPLPRGVPASEGPPDDCVITKIDQFAAELADRRLPQQERVLALKFLIHLIGDLHQPLHVTDEHDDHGSLIGVSAPNLPDATLFSYWDDLLVARLGNSPGAVADHLLSNLQERRARLYASGSPHLWALEAHELGVTEAYGRLGAIGRNGRASLSDADIEAASTVLSLQMTRAGVRLAYVINEALAPAPAARRICAS